LRIADLKAKSQESEFRIKVSDFFAFLTPACHAVAHQSVGGLPETLRFVAWDLRFQISVILGTLDTLGILDIL
jgi:hypothetical protein